MKTRLEQITVEEFVELLNGNLAPLVGHGAIQNRKKAEETARNIMFEFKEIADPTGFKSFLSTSAKLMKAKISLTVFTMCRNLADMNEIASIREILREYGINEKTMNDARVLAEVKSRLAKAKADILKLDAEKTQDAHEEETNIRRSFDEQTAMMMSHFKFQIDTSVMKASVYAHLLARFNREIQAELKAMRKNHK